MFDRRHAGGSSRRKFGAHRREALRREWRLWVGVVALAAVGVALIVFSGGLARVVGGWIFGFMSAVALVGWTLGGDVRSLPWLWGAWGEEETEEALRQLRGDWFVVHDVPNRFGNWHHIAVGPGGVFMLDSKRLRAPTKVFGDGLSSGRVQYSGGSFRGAAVELRESLRALVGECPFVQAVVVVWGDFGQGVCEKEHVAYVSGERLVGWLMERPPMLSESRSRELACGVEALVGGERSSVR